MGCFSWFRKFWCVKRYKTDPPTPQQRLSIRAPPLPPPKGDRKTREEFDAVLELLTKQDRQPVHDFPNQNESETRNEIEAMMNEHENYLKQVQKDVEHHKMITREMREIEEHNELIEKLSNWSNSGIRVGSDDESKGECSIKTGQSKESEKVQDVVTILEKIGNSGAESHCLEVHVEASSSQVQNSIDLENLDNQQPTDSTQLLSQDYNSSSSDDEEFVVKLQEQNKQNEQKMAELIKKRISRR